MSQGSRKSVMTMLAVVLLATVLALLLPRMAATLAQYHVAKRLSEGFGLTVSIGHTEVAGWPLVIVMDDVEVSHRHLNPVHLSRIHAELEWGPLLHGTLSIPLMRVEGVAMGQRSPQEEGVPSFQSGAAEIESVFPDLQTLPMATLVDAEKARFVEQINAFQQVLRDKRANWVVQLRELPDDKALALLKEQATAARNEEGAAALAARLDASLAQFSAVDQGLKDDWLRIQNQYLALKQLSEQSVNRIFGERGLNDVQLSALGRYLVHDAVQDWFGRGLAFHAVLSGREEHANDSESRSGLQLLVHKVMVGGVFVHGARQGHINGEILNLADAPGQLAEPVTLHLEASGEGIGELRLSALLDHRSPGREADHFNFSLQRTKFPRFVLADNQALALALHQVLLSVDMAGTITHEGALDLSLSSVFNTRSVSIEARSADKALVDKMAAALEQVHEVTVVGVVKGTLAQPALNMTTSLDEPLALAARKVVDARMAPQRALLSETLDAALQQLLAGLEGDLAQSSAMLDTARQRAEPFKRLRTLISP